MTNAEKYVPQIARLIANSLEGVCIQFARDIDRYGDFDCRTCRLRNICNDAEKLEAFLRQEAEKND